MILDGGGVRALTTAQATEGEIGVGTENGGLPSEPGKSQGPDVG
jgi:hypothetical protein